MKWNEMRRDEMKWMNAWGSEWVSEWVSECVRAWMGGWVGGWVRACVREWVEWVQEGKTNWKDERMNEWKKERMKEGMKEWRNGWINEGMDESMKEFLCTLRRHFPHIAALTRGKQRPFFSDTKCHDIGKYTGFRARECEFTRTDMMITRLPLYLLLSALLSSLSHCNASGYYTMCLATSSCNSACQEPRIITAASRANAFCHNRLETRITGASRQIDQRARSADNGSDFALLRALRLLRFWFEIELSRSHVRILPTSSSKSTPNASVF